MSKCKCIKDTKGKWKKRKEPSGEIKNKIWTFRDKQGGQVEIFTQEGCIQMSYVEWGGGSSGNDYPESFEEIKEYLKMYKKHNDIRAPKFKRKYFEKITEARF